jgi:hypothetical protein
MGTPLKEQALAQLRSRLEDARAKLADATRGYEFARGLFERREFAKLIRRYAASVGKAERGMLALQQASFFEAVGIPVRNKGTFRRARNNKSREPRT